MQRTSESDSVSARRTRVGVRKFRSVAEMPGPPPRPPLEPQNLRIAFELMELTERLHLSRRRPGVRKFRSWDEAHAHRQNEDRNSG